MCRGDPPSLHSRRAAPPPHPTWELPHSLMPMLEVAGPRRRNARKPNTPGVAMTWLPAPAGPWPADQPAHLLTG